MGVKDPLMLISRVVLYSCPPGYLDVVGCRITDTNSMSELCDEHAQCHRCNPDNKQISTDSVWLQVPVFAIGRTGKGDLGADLQRG